MEEGGDKDNGCVDDNNNGSNNIQESDFRRCGGNIVRGKMPIGAAPFQSGGRGGNKLHKQDARLLRWKAGYRGPVERNEDSQNGSRDQGRGQGRGAGAGRGRGRGDDRQDRYDNGGKPQRRDFDPHRGKPAWSVGNGVSAVASGDGVRKRQAGFIVAGESRSKVMKFED